MSFDINQVYNSDIAEIAQIAEIIYDKDGTTNGLSASDVDLIASLLVRLNTSYEEDVKQAQENAYEEARESIEEQYEEKYSDIGKELDKCKDEAYDKGYDEGYEDGVAFKKKMERMA